MIRLDFAIQLEQGAFTLDIADAASVEVLGLFGPSGSGKTSLLEVIAGLRSPTRGDVRVADQCLLDTRRGIDVPVHQRRVGYVPQDVALFPHLDVRRNVMYGRQRTADGRRGSAPGTERSGPHVALRIQQPGSDPVPATRHSALDDLSPITSTLEITHLMDRRIDQLSGGERQRVAIARALVSAPRLLLLDEPLTAVDRGRKDRILPYLLRIRRELHVPMVYVTHDVREMAEIADRVIRLDEGRVAQAGTPASVLEGQPDRGRDSRS